MKNNRTNREQIFVEIFTWIGAGWLTWGAIEGLGSSPTPFIAGSSWMEKIVNQSYIYVEMIKN